MTGGRSPTLRLRQGFVLLAGAIVFALIVGSGPDTFYWTPLGIGWCTSRPRSRAAARAATGRAHSCSSAGGPRSRTPVKRARISISRARTSPAPGSARAPRFAAIAAQRLGIKADALGATLTVVAAGTILALSGELPELTDARTYAVFVGAVGLVNIVWALLADRSR